MPFSKLVNRNISYTSLMDVVTPTERPKSVSKRCIIKIFGDVFMLSFLFLIFFKFSFDTRASVIELSQMSFFSSSQEHFLSIA